MTSNLTSPGGLDHPSADGSHEVASLHTGAFHGPGYVIDQADGLPLDSGIMLDLGEGDGIIGTPRIDGQFWHHQTTPFTCALVAQLGIINEFTGQGLSEAQLVYEATANGWISDEGTRPGDVGLLLEAHGIECHPVEHAEMGDVVAELALGHKVIVGVDAKELWDPGHPLHGFTHQAANHAIWVTGVDLSNPDNPQVIINDSGSPEGCGHAYDLRTFLEAWEASGYSYVATDHAPPGLAGRVPGFDEEHGMFTDLVDFVRGSVPGFLSHAGAALVGMAVGDLTGSGLAEAAGFAVAHRCFDKTLAAPPAGQHRALAAMAGEPLPLDPDCRNCVIEGL